MHFCSPDSSVKACSIFMQLTPVFLVKDHYACYYIETVESSVLIVVTVMTTC